MSIQSSSTDKWKAYREAVCRDSYRAIYMEIDREVSREVDQDSAEVTYRECPMKSTGWPPKRTSTDDCRIRMNLGVNSQYR